MLAAEDVCFDICEKCTNYSSLEILVATTAKHW
jgi:hypothetical protein